MNKNYFFIFFALIGLTLSCKAYNGKDLKWHTDCLINAVLTGEDLDVTFIKRHLSIGCDQQDVINTQDENLETIKKNFLTNPIVQIFKREDCVVKFEELSRFIDEIFKDSKSDIEKAACIVVAKETSRNLLGTLFANIKDDTEKMRLEGARKTFLEQLDVKRLVATEVSEEDLMRQSPKKQASLLETQPLPLELVEKIRATFPYIASLSSQQIGEMVLYFKQLQIK